MNMYITLMVLHVQCTFKMGDLKMSHTIMVSFSKDVYEECLGGMHCLGYAQVCSSNII